MKLLDFYGYLDKLKHTKRSGWVRKNITDPESVADHSFSVATLSMILAPKLNVDRDKLIKMALIHDIGESIIGDVVWHYNGKLMLDVLVKKEKDEGEAMRKILATLEDDEYLELWEEMEKKETREAKIHKEIDRIDLALQAYFYEEKMGQKHDQLFDFVKEYINEPMIIEVFEEIKTLRSK